MDTCPGPHVEMEGDAEYRRQLNLFSSCCTEKQAELVRLGEILNKVRSRERFLDIGAGGGHLTIPLSGMFQSTVVVEPNARQAEFLSRRCPKFDIHNCRFEDAPLSPASFDFVLCSHVLYYVNEALWPELVARMFGLLTPGGRLAIVLQAPVGQVADLFRAFTRYDVDLLGLWRTLNETYGEENVEVRTIRNEIWTENLEDLTDMALFLLLDARFRERRSEIRDYLERECKTEGGYRLVQDEVLLAVNKDDLAT